MKKSYYFIAAEQLANNTAPYEYVCHTLNELINGDIIFEAEETNKWVEIFKPSGANNSWTYWDNEPDEVYVNPKTIKFIRDARILALLFADLMDKDGLL